MLSASVSACIDAQVLQKHRAHGWLPTMGSGLSVLWPHLRRSEARPVIRDSIGFRSVQFIEPVSCPVHDPLRLKCLSSEPLSALRNHESEKAFLNHAFSRRVLIDRASPLACPC